MTACQPVLRLKMVPFLFSFLYFVISKRNRSPDWPDGLRRRVRGVWGSVASAKFPHRMCGNKFLLLYTTKYRGLFNSKIDFNF